MLVSRRISDCSDTEISLFTKIKARNRATVTRRAVIHFILQFRRAVVNGDISGQQLRIGHDLQTKKDRVINPNSSVRLSLLSRFILFRNCKEQNGNVTLKLCDTRFVLRRNSVLPDFFSFIIFSTKRSP